MQTCTRAENQNGVHLNIRRRGGNDYIVKNAEKNVSPFTFCDCGVKSYEVLVLF